LTKDPIPRSAIKILVTISQARMLYIYRVARKEALFLWTWVVQMAWAQCKSLVYIYTNMGTLSQLLTVCSSSPHECPSMATGNQICIDCATFVRLRADVTELIWTAAAAANSIFCSMGLEAPKRTTKPTLWAAMRQRQTGMRCGGGNSPRFPILKGGEREQRICHLYGPLHI
jgi:hypothetical protein